MVTYDLSKANFIDGVLIINTDDGIICIPQENCTSDERELFQEWNNLFPNGKIKEEIISIIIDEPIDEEKAFMAEAIIQMSTEIEIMKAQINTLTGGN